MNQPTVLIIADDAEFSRAVIARWQMERQVPAFTTMSGQVWSDGKSAACELAIVGSLRGNNAAQLVATLDVSSRPTIYIAADSGSAHEVHERSPRVLVLRQHEGWLDALVLLAAEALRRMEATHRARRAEQSTADQQRDATLGRYMRDMRHSFNNALTSVLGNAELMLLEPGGLSAEAREQVGTIHNMALRMHEMLQRFSSLESEMQFAEKESQPETGAQYSAYVPGASR